MKIETFQVGPIMTNCYAVSEGSEAVLIDAADYDPRIVSYFRDNALTVSYILLTHGHFDHTSGVKQLAEALGAKIAIHPADEEMLYDFRKSGALSFGVSGGECAEADLLLKEGDEIPLGDLALRVIETPGHTKGGVGYYTPGHLFIGDTLFEGSIGRTDLYGGSYETLLRSIAQKIYVLPEDTQVYPGHGGRTTVGYEKKNNSYVRG